MKTTQLSLDRSSSVPLLQKYLRGNTVSWKVCSYETKLQLWLGICSESNHIVMQPFLIIKALDLLMGSDLQKGGWDE